MPIDEREYQDRLERLLRLEYGSERVRREVRLESDREVDFVVDLWPTVLAIEAENRPEDVIHGVGQALLYAAELGGLALVIYPPTGADAAELRHLGERVALAPVAPESLPPVED